MKNYKVKCYECVSDAINTYGIATKPVYVCRACGWTMYAYLYDKMVVEALEEALGEA